MTVDAPAQDTYEAPPPLEVGVLGWIKQNLFNSWLDTILTLLSIGFLWITLVPTFTWAFTSANWAAVTTNMRILMHGPYPQTESWRVLLVGVVPLVLLGASYFVYRTRNTVARRTLTIIWVLSPVMFWFILNGFEAPVLSDILPRVETNRWGGLLLTIVLALVGILGSFPLGILLALGRRSSLPIIKWMSTIFIETVRGVPFITVLFMAQVLLPIFLPPDLRVPGLFRAMVGFVLFSSAYLAENVRGGLQAIPAGQREAARALGLNTWQEILFITLPQALRIVIPPLVNQFTGLFKDTTLVAIVGLLDILFVGKSILAQAGFLQAQKEVYTFIAFIFFVLCFALSVSSSRLEKRLGVGTR